VAGIGAVSGLVKVLIVTGVAFVKIVPPPFAAADGNSGSNENTNISAVKNAAKAFERPENTVTSLG